MDTTLIVYLDDQWKRIDLYEDTPINVVIQELDILDLNARKSTYSKTFTVPATSNNSIIFEHYFEVNGLDFNPLTKIQCAVQFRGTDIFNGILRLNSVLMNPNYTEYEVYILSDVGDFGSEIKNIKLRDLNWTDLLHAQTYDNIHTSWEADDTDTNGLLGGQILYPLVHWGYQYQAGTTGDTPDWRFSFGDADSFDQPSYAVPEYYFKPSVRVKTVLDKIFEQTTYNYVSDFFDTDYFHSIYMDTFQNGALGIQQASGVTNENIFKGFTPQFTKNYKGNQRYPFPSDTRLPGGYDPLTNFDNINDCFRVPYTGKYYFNLRFDYKSRDIIQFQGSFNIAVYKHNQPTNIDTNGVFVWASDQYKVGFRPFTGIQQGSINLFFEVTANAGEYIKVFVEENLPYAAFGISNPKGVYVIQPYEFGGIQDRFIQYDLYNSPALTSDNIVDVKLGVPDIVCADFIKDLVTMFNLVVIQDEENRTIRFEPYPWYYNEDDRVERDFTQRLDLNSQYKVEPLSFELAKEINFNYSLAGEEGLNYQWELKNNYPYGQYRFVADSNLLTNEQNYTLSFAALPTTSLDGAPNFIIPEQYRYIAPRYLPYASKNHIFFWAGNRYAYTDPAKTIQGTWYMYSGSTPVAQSTYPAISHLSSLDLGIPNLVSDLNFGGDFDFFGDTNNQPVQFSPYNLYNTFWYDYLDNNYSRETRRLTGRFFMKPLDVYETSLTDKIFVKDSFYRIEKMNEADLTDNKLTEISLIKERGGYYKIEPPSPIYAVGSNEPYPGLLPTFTGTSYTGTTLSTVCDGTANTGDVLTFGWGAYTNLQKVYYDTGTAYKIFPMGTYLRLTGSTDTYVVADVQGRILPIDC